MAKVITDERQINELLTRRVDEVIVRSHLKKELLSGRRLKIKLGIDPTSPDLHLGHSVVLMKLREFQDLGHKAILVIGDFTAKIGDPSGRTTERKKLTDKDIQNNLKTYKKQAGKILDLNKLVVRYNSEWLEPLGIPGFLDLASKATINQILKRKDFKKRIISGEDLSTLETIYPLLQGYDSVALNADVELGGTDQKLNLLMGRQLQKRFGQKEQDIMTTKLLVGLDGKIKMSKSVGNVVGLLESPNDMFAKLMSIQDKFMLDYFNLCTTIPIKEISKLPQLVSRKRLTPLEQKKELAREIVSMYYSKTAAEESQKEFERVVQEKGIPEKIKNEKLKIKNIKLIDLLIKLNLVSSKAEAKRLIMQGGVAINTKIFTEPHKVIEILDGMIVRAGKKKFVRVRR